MGAFGALLLNNPLTTGISILAILAGIGFGAQTVRVKLAQAAEAKAESSLASEKLEFINFKKNLAEQSAREAKENQQRSEEKAQALASDFITIQTTASEVKEALNAAKSTGACERDPKWRATVGGMRDIGRGVGAGAAAGKTN